jgi:hypothetical protein
MAVTGWQCAVLLGFDPATGTATTPVAAIACSAAELAVSWLPFTDGRSEAWRAVLASTPYVTEWAQLLGDWAADASSTRGLVRVVTPPAALDLRDAAELIVDALLASPPAEVG